MSDSPAARRILDNAMQTRAQTQGEAYDDLVRLLREPDDGTGPRVMQEVPFVEPLRRRPARRLLHPFYGGPAVGLGIVALLLIVRWIGWI